MPLNTPWLSQTSVALFLQDANGDDVHFGSLRDKVARSRRALPLPIDCLLSEPAADVMGLAQIGAGWGFRFPQPAQSCPFHPLLHCASFSLPLPATSGGPRRERGEQVWFHGAVQGLGGAAPEVQGPGLGCSCLPLQPVWRTGARIGGAGRGVLRHSLQCDVQDHGQGRLMEGHEGRMRSSPSVPPG